MESSDDDPEPEERKRKLLKLVEGVTANKYFQVLQL